jgi:hypothetical protein
MSNWCATNRDGLCGVGVFKSLSDQHLIEIKPPLPLGFLFNNFMAFGSTLFFFHVGCLYLNILVVLSSSSFY